MKTLRDAGFDVSNVPGLDQTDFIINSNPNKKEHRELLDLKVKEAFDHAIDRQKINDVTWLGAAQTGRLDHSRPRPAPGTTRTSSCASFDLALANKLLDQAGFKQGLGWDPRRERPEDVLQRDRADRRRRASRARSRSSRPTSRRSACS